MGTSTNYIATNREMAQKLGYKGTVQDVSHLCTYTRSLGYGGYSPNYRKGYDNRCIQYNDSIYTCGTNTATNCTIAVSSVQDSSGLKVSATATAQSGYDMQSLTLQTSAGATIQTTTVPPFTINWTPNQNFKFTATAVAQQTYTIRYTTTNNQILQPSEEKPFDVNIMDNRYYGTYGIMTLSGDPTTVYENAFTGNQYLKTITLPDTIKYIERKAFQDCSAMTGITLGGGLKEIGDGAFYRCSALTTVIIPESVDTIGVEVFGYTASLASITVDGNNTVFDSRNNCNAIIDTQNNVLVCGCMNTVIPNTVRYLCDYAFLGCTGLTSIAIPSSVTSFQFGVFYDCTGLTSISLSSVTSIGHDCFFGCTGLTKLTIPSTLTSIGQGAFYNCTGLTEIECISTTPATLGSQAFNNTNNCPIYVKYSALNTYKGAANWSAYQARIQVRVTHYINYTTNDASTITVYATATFGSAHLLTNTYTSGQGKLGFDSSVTAIDGAAFISCYNLTSMTLPDTVLSIGDGAFNYDASLASITLGNSLVSIGVEAFGSNESLTTLTLPNTLTTIGDYAFSLCSGLTSMMIPINVSSIGESVFSGCDGLTSIMVNSGNATYMSSVNCVIRRSDNALIAGCKTSVIPNTVTRICYGAFLDIFSLTSIAIPSSVTVIEESAFESCHGLTTITLPASISTLGSRAFYDCNQLTWVKSMKTTPPTIGAYAFDHTNNCPIYVPATSVSAYQTSWSSYQARIQSLPTYTMNYTSSNGQIVVPNVSTGYGDANIIANTYSGGVGTYTFDAEPTFINNNAFQNRTTLTSMTLPNSVTSVGVNAFYACIGLTSVVMPAVQGIGNYAFASTTTLTTITLPTTLTLLAHGCFNWSNLTSLSIPSSVTTISGCIASGCSALSSITVDANNSVYDSRNNCNAIVETNTHTLIQGCKDSSIPNTVLYIGAEAFYSTTTLTSIVIPSSVQRIYDGAFTYCSGLTSITCEGTTPAVLGNLVFDYTNDCPIYVPSTAVSTYQSAWSAYSERITAIPVPKMSVMSQGEATPTTTEGWGAKISKVSFDKETSTTTIEFESAPTTIPRNAFAAHKAGIISVDSIPNTITTIDDEAFVRNALLESVVIPASVENIGNAAFASCASMTSITCEATTPPNLGSNVFASTNDCPIYVPAESLELYQGAKGWIEYAARIQAIPGEETEMLIGSKDKVQPRDIENWGADVKDIVYDEKAQITTIIFSGEPDTVPVEAFVEMPSIISVNIPEAIKYIGTVAFAICENLGEVMISSTVTEIGSSAFGKCVSMTSITCLATTPPNLGENVFASTNDCPIYVPAESLELYQEAKGWTEYAKRIQAIPGEETEMLIGSTEKVVPKDTENWGAKISSIEYDEKTQMTTITFDGEPSWVPETAFAGYPSIMTVEITESIQYIGGGAFTICANLTEVIIPSTIVEIYNNAFTGCASMTSITCLATTPPVLGSVVFKDTNNCPIYVPVDSYERYLEASGWSEYGKRITPIE